MAICVKHYTEPDAREALVQAFNLILNDITGQPLFICIGSDRHLLDCWGPLTGTMIKEKEPEILVYGTLENPLHARNLNREIREIRDKHRDRVEIAIDASAGSEAELGTIKLRQGELLPGKALSKRLIPVGEFAIIGTVAVRPAGGSLAELSKGSIAPVYHMARQLSEAIVEWNRQRNSNRA